MIITKCFFEMAASHFVEVTDKEINNCFKENAYFSNDHLCDYMYTKTKLICSPHLQRIINYCLKSRLESNEEIQSQFCDKIQKFSRKIVALHYFIGSVAKQNVNLQYLCLKKHGK